MHTILVPTDFSSASRHAGEYALSLALVPEALKYKHPENIFFACDYSSGTIKAVQSLKYFVVNLSFRQLNTIIKYK